VKKQEHYKIAGIVVLVLSALAFLYQNKMLFYGTLGFAILLYSFEAFAVFFAKWWMKLGKFLGDVNSRIILSIFFLFILTPVALLKKLVSYKRLEGKSSWQNAGAEVDLTKPW
jgi:hypothetical protein